jgi:hypothetical protein
MWANVGGNSEVNRKPLEAKMGEYCFGTGPGWLGKKAAAVARKHGAELVNHTDPECSCGWGCAPRRCKRSRRHWFATENRGWMLDQKVSEAVMNELAENVR